MPTNGIWPYQTGLTYPFDVAIDSGLIGPTDPRVFKTHKDEVHFLSNFNKFSLSLKGVIPINHEYIYYTGTDLNHTINDP
jgi:hypothetical protein